MSKKIQYFIAGIGFASILAGIVAAYRSGELMDSLFGVFVGVSLIGTIWIERKKKS